MKLIIAGGRKYQLTGRDFYCLDLHFKKVVSEVISGGASGADSDGEYWAKRSIIPFKIFKADWKKYGKSAGPRRNVLMAQYADAVVLFPGGSGTESMYQEAKKYGIKIYDWRNADVK